MSKTALDRLGTELVTGGQVSDVDLENLARVVDAYQQVLDDVQAQLTTFGYDATTRVKTTSTLVAKLRRQRRTRLSQVRDLAGARAVVFDRPAQDEAVTEIRRLFEASGYACKEFDRRKDPSYGYRAVHLVVQVGPVPVEIQVRTELEDTWAQIVERLADRWGRGIRYGEDPDCPEATVRASGQVISRRAVMAYLGELSDAIDGFELTRAVLVVAAPALELFGKLMSYVRQFREAQDQRSASEIPAGERAMADMMAASLAQLQGSMTDPPNVTVAQMIEALGLGLDSIREENDAMLGQLRDRERVLRDTLQLIASARDEGE